jgi:hypothetical protein
LIELIPLYNLKFLINKLKSVFRLYSSDSIADFLQLVFALQLARVPQLINPGEPFFQSGHLLAIDGNLGEDANLLELLIHSIVRHACFLSHKVACFCLVEPLIRSACNHPKDDIFFIGQLSGFFGFLLICELEFAGFDSSVLDHHLDEAV